MIDRTERTFALKPKRLIADTAYGSGRFLGWLVKEKAITPHIPVWDMSKRKDGAFSRFDFSFNKRRNHYTCPAGKTLTTTGRVATDNGSGPITPARAHLAAGESEITFGSCLGACSPARWMVGLWEMAPWVSDGRRKPLARTGRGDTLRPARSRALHSVLGVAMSGNGTKAYVMANGRHRYAKHQQYVTAAPIRIDSAGELLRTAQPAGGQHG